MINRFFKWQTLHFLLLAVFLLGSGIRVSAQKNPDDVIGYYLVEDPFTKAISQIRMYKTTDGSYAAKVCWNKDKSHDKYLGLLFLSKLRYDPEKQCYVNGRIKYPGKPGTYSATMDFDSDGRLRVRGYLGVSVLGMTIYWTKEDKQRTD